MARAVRARSALGARARFDERKPRRGVRQEDVDETIDSLPAAAKARTSSEMSVTSRPPVSTEAMSVRTPTSSPGRYRGLLGGLGRRVRWIGDRVPA